MARRPAIQDMRETPQLDRARMIVRPLLHGRRYFTTRDLAREHRISHVIFETAVACERARYEAIQEVKSGVPKEEDPPTLTKISIHELIEKLSPLFARVKDQSMRHVATLSKSELAIIAHQGQRHLDEWASGDVSVRRVRGHVVSSKHAAVKEEDDDESSLPADFERNEGPHS